MKVQQNLPLLVAEEELLAECYRRYYSKPKESMSVDNDGTVVVRRQVDAEPVLQAMKDYADIIDRRKTGAAGAKMYGSLDPITCAIFQKESGLRLGTKAFAQFVKKKLKDRDFSGFRFGGAQG